MRFARPEVTLEDQRAKMARHPLHQGAPIADNDAQRVDILARLGLLDTPPEKCFDRIAKSAAECFKVPISLVSLVDSERTWCKASIGFNVSETPRDLAFCAHAILAAQNEVFEIPDAREDDRFKHSPVVLGEPHIRFYAGAPLEYEDAVTNTTVRLGTLCIIDSQPRTLSDGEKGVLMTLARLTVAEVHLRQEIAREHKTELERVDQSAWHKAKILNWSYIGQVAHDLKTPLNSFSLGLQELTATELSSEQRAIVGAMELSAELMTLTCSKAMDFTRLEHGKPLKVNRMRFNIVEMLAKSKTIIMGYTHDSKQVKYEFTVSEDLATAWMVSDHDFVWQMLMNLLINARKFTTAGYIRTIVSLCAKQTLRVEVADTGIGVREDEAHLLFKPFGQLQAFCGGTGLGLFSVLAKANALGGTAGVSPNAPKGSVFWFQIPYVQGEPEPGDATPSLAAAKARTSDEALTCSGSATASISAGQTKNDRASPRGEGGGGRGAEAGRGRSTVLVIEDDVPTRTLMLHGLRKLGYEVDEAGNGEEGFLKMQARLYNMVLSDIMMPVMDGFECARRLREWETASERPRQYICALSANFDETHLEKCVDIDYFFPKPVRIKTLIQRLEGRFMTLPQCQGNDHGQQQSESLRERERERERKGSGRESIIRNS